MTDIEKDEKKEERVSAPPSLHYRDDKEASQPAPQVLDGGLQAWLTVLGGWCMYFCGLGYFMAFGVYQDFYTRDFLSNKTASEVAWIGGAQIAVQFICGMPVGMAFDAGYFHHLEIGGAIIYSFSLFMVSLAKPHQFYQLFLAQGIGMGIGLSMTFLPAASVLSHHFSRRLGLAMGIMVSGGSLGGVVFPIMLNKLVFGPQGFAVGVRASAGVVAGMMALGNLLMRARPELQPKDVKRVSLKSLVQDFPYMMSVTAGLFIFLGLFYLAFYMQLYSILAGIDPVQSFYTVTYINIGGFFGRILVNFLADHFGAYTMAIPITALCSLSVFVLLATKTLAGAIVVSLFYGAVNGAFVSLTPNLSIEMSNDMSEIGTRMGLWFTFMSIPALIGSPISGALLGPTFNWTNGTVFAGLALAIGAVVLIYARHLLNQKRARLAAS